MGVRKQLGWRWTQAQMPYKGPLAEGQLKPLWGQTPPEAEQEVPLEGSGVVW